MFKIIIMVSFFGSLLTSITLEARIRNHALKDRGIIYQQQLTNLKIKMSQMEQELNLKQDIYLQKLQKVKELDMAIDHLSKNLNETNQKMLQQKKELRKIMPGYLTGLVEKEDSFDGFYERELVARATQRYLKELNEQTQLNEKREEELNQLKAQLFEYSTATDEMEKILLSLENERKNLLDEYQRELLKKTVEPVAFREKYKEKERVKDKEIKEMGEFIDLPLPMDSYISLEKGKKGVTIQFGQGQLPITAVQSGVIVYVGELSSYGQVIMIDHGHDFRSILLGGFTPKVQKQQKVKQGEIVAYTISSLKKTGQIYLELRKQNQVYNNIKWMSTQKGII